MGSYNNYFIWFERPFWFQQKMEDKQENYQVIRYELQTFNYEANFNFLNHYKGKLFSREGAARHLATT